MAASEPRWTLEDLGAQVEAALSLGYEGQANGRVREVPDPRTIRYYTTLGLIDRPAEMRGRTAFYGRRHLLQLVAIKKLQAKGLTLAEVQEELLGLSPKSLERLAGLQPDLAARSPSPAMSAGARSGAGFWKDRPARILPAQSAPEGSGEGSPAAIPLQLIELRDGVSLLLKQTRTASREDVDAIRAAAASLLELLDARRLARGDNERCS